MPMLKPASEHHLPLLIYALSLSIVSLVCKSFLQRCTWCILMLFDASQDALEHWKVRKLAPWFAGKCRCAASTQIWKIPSCCRWWSSHTCRIVRPDAKGRRYDVVELWTTVAMDLPCFPYFFFPSVQWRVIIVSCLAAQRSLPLGQCFRRCRTCGRSVAIWTTTRRMCLGWKPIQPLLDRFPGYGGGP